MTYIDISTKYDLQELQEMYENAQSRQEEEKIEKRMADIIYERGDARMREWRDVLITATRDGDRRAVRRAQMEIKRIEQDRKYGRASI